MAYDNLTTVACLAAAAAYSSVAVDGEYVLSDVLSDAQARVSFDGHTATVAFRGSSSASDWAHNAMALQTPLPMPHRPEVRAHAGFLRQYCSLHTRLLRVLEESEARHVLLSGHSLGGALATIAAALLPSAYTCDLVTFGAPRAGNTRMVELARLRCVRVVRVVHDRDVVPTIPMRLMGYSHVPGDWLLLQPDTTLQEMGCERTLLQELWLRTRGVLAADFGISDHFITSYLAGCAPPPTQTQTPTPQPEAEASSNTPAPEPTPDTSAPE
jgi:hypothetical protein